MTEYLTSLDFDLTGLDLSGMTREEILSAMVEAALAGADRDDLDESDAPFAWDESLHPRDERGRWTTSGGVSAEERAARRSQAGSHAKEFLAKGGRASPEEITALARHLSGLTVNQLHDLKREHGLKASGPDKAALVGKLALRIHEARQRQKAADDGRAAAEEAHNQSQEAMRRQYDAPVGSLDEVRSRLESLRDDLRSGIIKPAEARTIHEKLVAIGNHLAAAPQPGQKPAGTAADSRKAAVLKAAGASASHDGNIRDLAAIAAKHDTLDAAAREAERKGILDPAALASDQARRGERQGTSGADAYYRGVLEAAYKGGSKPAPAPAAEKPVRVTPAAPAGAETPFRAEHFTEQAAARQMTEFIRSHIDQDVLERLNPDPGSPLDGVGQVGNQTVFPIGGKFYVVDRGKEGQKYTETLREVPAHQVEPYRRPGRLRRGSVAGFSGDAPPALRPVRFVPGKFTPARQEVAT